ncbi:MAG: hypothetical protein WD181_06975 [Solirubrobacterales bacterium]
MDRRQILGAIPLDTGAFDIEKSVVGSDPDEPSLLFGNAFGSLAENAATNSWETASPLTWADSADPRHLFIVQNVFPRINRQVEMATRLGQESSSVVAVLLNHSGVNRAVGSPTDTTQTTPAITTFVADRLARYLEPQVKVTKRPANVVQLARNARSEKPVRRVLSFAFNGSGNISGLQCRLDGAAFRNCSSPRRYTIGPGGHSFRVRPLYPSGRPGEEKLVKFRAVARKRR